jgi:hypothetical protein
MKRRHRSRMPSTSSSGTVASVGRWSAGAAALLFTAPGTAAVAQTPADLQGVNVGAAFETYRFADEAVTGIESITLFTAPFTAGARIGSRIGLSVRGAWARGSMSLADGGTSTIDGLSDTEVRATLSAGTDLVTISAIALLPTGRDLLAADEVEVAGVVGADVLPFRITNWGSGGGLGGSAALAVPAGEFGVGVSVGYVVTRDYEPIETSPSFVYRPGNQLHVTAALDRTVGQTGKLGLRASLLTYDADRANEINLYRAGNRLEAVASYAFVTGPRSSAIVWGGVHHRDAGEFEEATAGSTVVPASDILFAGIAWRVPFASGVLQPAGDLRVVSGSDGVSRGYIAGAAVSAELPAGAVVLAPTVRARFGSVEPPDGASSSVIGADIGMVVRFGGR